MSLLIHFVVYNLTGSVDRLSLQVMDSQKASELQRPSFKQMAVHEPTRNPSPPSISPHPTVYTSPLVRSLDDQPVHFSDGQLSQRMVEDNQAPKLIDSGLRDMSPFCHLYLIGEVLGKVVPIKFIMAKYSVEWQVVHQFILAKYSVGWQVIGEVSFNDMGSGFCLVKFTNEVDRNRVFDGQPWFVGDQVYSLRNWKKRILPY